jgi:hypothetical protein
MTPTSKNARIAGFRYLLLVIAGPIRPHVCSQQVVRTWSASATANNIAAHENLFRLGIVSDLFCGTILISSCWLFTGCSREWTRTTLC